MRNKILLSILLAFIGYQISYGQIYSMSGNNGQSITTCRGVVRQTPTDQNACYSNGSTGGYANNINQTVTFCSGTGLPLKISFLFWDVETNYDYIYIYDGTSTSAPLIGTITGSNDIYFFGPRAFTSSGTCLTIRFSTDGSTTWCGFEAILGCQPTTCGTGTNLPASDACSAAPQICDLNGYCGNTSGWYTRDNGQIDSYVGNSQFCGSIENNSWISFIASAATATLNVNSFNCAYTTTGIQARVYSTTNCTSFTSMSNCVSQSTGSGAFTVTATGLTVGTKYYLMIDGFAGNICDYTVAANTGVQVLSFSSSASNSQICEGTTTPTTISINGAIAGSTYAWTASPAGSIIGATNGSSISVNPSTTTTYSVVVTQPNGCLTQTESFTLTVNPKKTTTLTQTVCAGQSVNVCGTNYNTSGTFTKVCTSSKGCDSTVTLNLTVRPAITSTITRAVCAGQSITVCGQVYNTSGTFTKVCTSASGCDSTVTINLTVRQPITSTVTQTVCAGQSITVCGQVYNTSGTFTKICTSASGCDSTVTINLTVRQPITSTVTQTVCAGQSITVCGQVYNTSGTFTKVCTSASGCDSTVTINLTVRQPITSTVTQTVCAGQSITVCGQVYNTSGTFTKVCTSASGCDSTVTINLTVRQPITSTVTQTVCAGQSITVCGQVYNTSGTFTKVCTSSTGCDSTVTINLTVRQPITSTVTQTVCAGQSITVCGQVYNTSGTFTKVCTSASGCDSTVTINLTVRQPITSTVTQTVCAGQSITVCGQVYNTSGTFTKVCTSASGCDSTVTINLTVRQPITSTVTQTVCAGQSITVCGQVYNTSGTFTKVCTSASGCDSTVTINLTVRQPITSTVTQTVCAGQSITVCGQVYNTSGTFTKVCTSASGCDSTVTINLTVRQPITSTVTQTVCAGQSITICGQVYNTSGTFTKVCTSASGCDSTVTINLTVRQPITSTVTQAVCAGQSITVCGQVYNTSGTFTKVCTSATGCDSTVTINLTINPIVTTNVSQQLCNGQSISFNGNTITQAGTYRDTLQTSLACDSFIVLTVTVVPFKTTNISQAICQGQSITFNGNTITQAGTYRDTLQTTLGCDSFVVLTVSLNPVKTTNISQAICQGQSITFNGNTITQAGTYRDTLQTSLGCDSFVVLTVSLNPVKTTNISQAICQGQSITFNGNTITQAGTYRDTLQTSLGCDSFIVLTVTLNPVKTTNISQAICQGQSITFNGNTIAQAGTYRDTLQTSLGCDSFVVLTVTVKPTPTTQTSQQLCNGQSITFNGNTITQAGTYRDTLQTSLGCDSFVVLTVTVVPFKQTDISQSICQGQSITFNGNTITQAGIYRDTLQTSLGCDSFVVLTVTLNPVQTTNIAQAICQGQSIMFNGNTITQAGTYRDTLQTSLGCDSFVILTVTLNPVQTTNIAQAICQGQSITFNGNTITQAGTYRDTLQTSLGCDSFVVLTLTIKPTSTTQISQQLCNGQSIVFNGNIITQDGTYRDTLQTSLGCDSFVVLTVTVVPFKTTNIEQSICQGDSIIFNGNTIIRSGIYRDTFTTSLGCDSFIVLTVTVLQPSNTTINATTCNPNNVGTTVDTIVAANGCDSIITTITTLLPTSNTTINATTCNPNSVGTNIQTLIAANGCDSIVTTITTLLPSSSITINLTTCNPSNVGTSVDTIAAANGCDSIVTTITTLLPSSSITINLTTCNPSNVGTTVDTIVAANGCDSIITTITALLPSSSITINLTTCNPSNVGTTVDTIVAANGCDSIITKITTLLPSSNTTINATTCNPGNVGTSVQTLTAANGCDSVVTTITTLRPSINTAINATTCDSNKAGITIDTLLAANGCDSIVTTTTVLLPSQITSIAQEICSGSSIIFNNQTITVAGTYADTLFTTQGCDSFIVMTVTIKTTPVTNISQKICQGSSFTFNGNSISQSGTYKDTLTTSAGCDSIISLDLVVNALPDIQITTDKTSLISGESAQLGVTTPEALSYNWSPSNAVSNPAIQNPLATLSESTWLVVTATNANTACSIKDSVFIEFNNISCSKENVFIPNAFTPNGDDINDVFKVRSQILKSMKLIVQDRWGHTVFESNDMNIGWDGNYKGTAALIDTYAFYFVGECQQGEKITIKGNVTLLK